jgi:hypothetical protein
MRDPEEILYAYLEGTGSRADVEQVLRRLNLDPAMRREIGRTLELLDDLGVVLREGEPPAGSVGRLIERLRGRGAPARMPGWSDAELESDHTAGESLEMEGLEEDERLCEDVRKALDEATAPEGAAERLRQRLRERMAEGEKDLQTVRRLLGHGPERRTAPEAYRPTTLAAGIEPPEEGKDTAPLEDGSANTETPGES